MHQFKAAEPVARELIKARGLSFDLGLLGDVLMEQGRLKEAIAAYQEMMNQKPNLQAYSRAAHVRWLTGDVKGAIEVARMAAQAGSPQDRESAAWAYTRLAFYEWQLGQSEKAQTALNAALELYNAYAPALLLEGRMLLAKEKANDALSPLQRAAALNPLPEYQWTLAEALRSAGKPDEAAKIDGASSWRILWQIIIPLCKPAIATMATLGFIGSWNNFLGPLIFLNTETKYTLAVGLRYFQSAVAGGAGAVSRPQDHLLMGAALMVALPCLILFFLGQKYFVQGIVTTGIKG